LNAGWGREMTEADQLREQGIAAAQEGNLKEARQRFRQALALDPDDARLHHRLGMIHMAQGRSKRALSRHEKACKLNPDVARYHLHRGDALQRLKKNTKAVEAYAKSLEIDPRNAVAWNNRGFANFNLNRWNEALRCYDEAMQVAPTYAVAWYNYGYTLQLAGRLDDALDYYRRSLDLDPGDAIAWNNLANVYYNQGHYEKSIELFHKALEVDPEYVVAINNIGNAYDYLEEYEKAIPWHEKALEKDSTFHYAYMSKGRALTRLGRPEEGLGFIETSIELHNDDADYYEALGSCLLALGRPQAARQAYNDGLKQDADHVGCWMGLGNTAEQRGDIVKALRCFDEAVRAEDMLARQRGRDVEWMKKAELLINSGMEHEGLRQFGNALNVTPESVRARVRQAELMLEFDLVDEAREVARQALALKPGSLPARRVLARCTPWEEARQQLLELRRENPDDPAARKALGLHLAEREPRRALKYLNGDDWESALARIGCHRRLKQWQRALTAAEEATARGPDRIEGWLALGWLWLELENPYRASSAFDGALGCDPDDAEALMGKATALEKRGRDTRHLKRRLKTLAVESGDDEVKSGDDEVESGDGGVGSSDD